MFKQYSDRLQESLANAPWDLVEELAQDLLSCWKDKRQLFICGNGGSAGNAVHIANDFSYGIAQTYGEALRVHALPANTSVLTCLANDIGYENVFSHQLLVQANKDDLLIAMSGSGNSPNVVKALDAAKDIGMKSFAILGFSGGKAKDKADVPIHFQIDDMQVSEDLQVILCHMIMQWLHTKRDEVIKR